MSLECLPRVDCVLSETTDHQEEMKETRVTVFTPVVVIISAAIAILGILLVIGFVTESGEVLQVLHFDVM